MNQSRHKAILLGSKIEILKNRTMEACSGRVSYRKARASGICETRRSHRPIVGRLGTGMGEKFTTQRATKIAAGGFPLHAIGKFAKELNNNSHT
jgi:hypothetical protein